MRKKNLNGSLVHQVKIALESQLAIGQSRHMDKKKGLNRSHIYMWETYRTYLRHACDFAKWAKAEHKARNLDECKQYAAEYVSALAAGGKSASTQKLVASAIAKVYQCSTKDLKISTPPRCRADITRSRGDKASDMHFSEARNKDLIDFCRGTGLRNHKELQQLRGSQLERREDGYYLVDIKGKGGRLRTVPVLPDYENTVERCCLAAGAGLVWPHVSSHADIHSYRAEYAKAWYKLLARPLEAIPPEERYYCRRDMRGFVWDKKAMLTVSKYLGHSRISVIAGYYLY